MSAFFATCWYCVILLAFEHEWKRNSFLRFGSGQWKSTKLEVSLNWGCGNDLVPDKAPSYPYEAPGLVDRYENSCIASIVWVHAVPYSTVQRVPFFDEAMSQLRLLLGSHPISFARMDSWINFTAAQTEAVAFQPTLAQCCGIIFLIPVRCQKG